MKRLLVLALCSASAFADSPPPVGLNSPVGKWKTIDDSSGKPRSLVEITEKDGILEGKIVKLFREPNEEQNPMCEECDGEKKGKPILGMQILSGLKKERQKWAGGRVLDPKNGKTYNCYVKLIEDGKKLEMRGYLGGITLLGRTQVWERQ